MRLFPSTKNPGPGVYLYRIRLIILKESPTISKQQDSFLWLNEIRNSLLDAVKMTFNFSSTDRIRNQET